MPSDDGDGDDDDDDDGVLSVVHSNWTEAVPMLLLCGQLQLQWFVTLRAKLRRSVL